MSTISIQGFSGINNKLPAHRIRFATPDVPTVELTVCRNIDLDNSERAVMRQGYTRIVTVSGCHSGYGALGTFLYVLNSILYQFSPATLASLPLLNVQSNQPMKYCIGGGKVFFTNGAVIGEYHNGQASLFPTTDKPFKTILPAGNAIAYFKGRLYVFRGNTLWISDVKPYNRTDLRYGFKQFPAKGVTIAPTIDGIYAATEKAVYWLGGTNPLKMTLRQVSDRPGIDAPVQFVEADRFKGIDFDGIVPVITTIDGISAGLPGGTLLNLTNDRYIMPTGTQGAAMIRIDDYGQFHYVTAYR